MFRSWKNFLFVIIFLGLLLLQACFWLVDTGYVKADSTAAKGGIGSMTVTTEVKSTEAAKSSVSPAGGQTTSAIVEQNQPTSPTTAKPQPKGGFDFNLRFEHLSWLIRFLNFVLVPASVLYCLTMLFCLKVSLLGRLGGINHITRAFFLSLTVVILLLPWQVFFNGVVAGAMYRSKELIAALNAVESKDVIGITLYYLRFTGLWAVVILLLIFSQVRSSRWARAILRRLEVV